MARKKAVRRENGRGTVEKTNSKKNPFKTKVPVGTKVEFDYALERRIVLTNPASC